LTLILCIFLANTRSKKVYWSMEFLWYYQEDNKTEMIRLKTKPIEENIMLCDALDSIAKTTNTKLNLVMVKHYGKFDIMSIIKEGGLKCYLKCEEDPRVKKIIQVDWFSEIFKILIDRTIVEFPTFIIGFTNESELKKQFQF